MWKVSRHDKAPPKSNLAPTYQYSKMGKGLNFTVVDHMKSWLSSHYPFLLKL